MPLTAQKSLKYRVSFRVSIARAMDVPRRGGSPIFVPTIAEPPGPGHRRSGRIPPVGIAGLSYGPEMRPAPSLAAPGWLGSAFGPRREGLEAGVRRRTPATRTTMTGRRRLLAAQDHRGFGSFAGR